HYYHHAQSIIETRNGSDLGYAFPLQIPYQFVKSRTIPLLLNTPNRLRIFVGVDTLIDE
ncbi:MAG: hypothetical protein IT440_06955, partial [Phycisphaeraceae bacterium]|nr:hypothetical protein [Phycisphaeraceae bacterium]